MFSLLASLVFNLALLFAPFFLLKLEGVKNKKLLERIFLKKEKLFPLARRTIALLGAFLIVLLVEGLVLKTVGVADQEKIAFVVSNANPWLLLMAVTLGPIAEELFFRGYIQQKLGVFVTSVIFALFHYGYGSIAEIIAAFSVSVLLGLELRKNKNIIPCILAHAFYNLFSITLILSFYG
ncbi:MAG: type II CAAX endopeptidase family protein [Candidatus Micrarchaeota archaeon]